MARPAPETLQHIVSRIVATAEPDQVILFGSAARGTMGPDSDIDLLVVKPGCFDRARLTGDIYKSLRGLECNVEVIVATPEEIEKYKNSPALDSCLEDLKQEYSNPTFAVRRSFGPKPGIDQG